MTFPSGVKMGLNSYDKRTQQVMNKHGLSQNVHQQYKLVECLVDSNLRPFLMFLLLKRAVKVSFFPKKYPLFASLWNHQYQLIGPCSKVLTGPVMRRWENTPSLTLPVGPCEKVIHKKSVGKAKNSNFF